MTGLTGNNAITGAGYRKNQPPYEIDQSLRLEDGDSPKLTRTPGSAGSLKTWTISAWVKRGNLSDGVVISAGNYAEVKFSSDTLYIGVGPTNSTQFAIQTSAVYRDPSAWYHIVVAADTTQASASNRLKLYVNGEEVTAFAVDQRSSISQDVALTFTGAYEHRIGVDESSAYFDGYIAEVNFIDGQALTPASFGETNSATNQWVPLEYVGSYGTNGFYQKYSTPYGIEAFTSTGSHTWTCPAGVTSVAVLTVAGGGGGAGYYGGGGGGAGGIVHASSYTVVPGTVYDLTVGAGGASNPGATAQGNDGSDSVFNVNAEGSGLALTAKGGGGGGGYANPPGPDGRDGGSGGGSNSRYGNSGSAGDGGSSTQASFSGATSYGNVGGSNSTSTQTETAGSGGGGAGEAGNTDRQPGTGGNDRGGDGGDGVYFSTFASYGDSGYFGGGGGGGGGNTSGDRQGGAGGQGGGGVGAEHNTTAAGNGTANTGGGGGGASQHNSSPGSTGGGGGSGVILISVDAGIGADSSGNGNNFSATNLVATDQVLDSPTNNYCTLSPLWVPPQAPAARGKLSEGNLSVSSPDTSSAGYNGATLGTIGVASGKWYFEYYAASANYPAIGIAKTDYNQNYATTNVGNRVWLDER
jgi:hypothetical protein